MSPFKSDAEYEAATLSHWQEREADLGDVTITVRDRSGKIIRMTILGSARAKAEITPDQAASFDSELLAAEASPPSTEARTPR